MKYLRRYLSLLVALALSVGLFSVTAHAESYTFKGDLVIEELEIVPAQQSLNKLEQKGVSFPLSEDYQTELTDPGSAMMTDLHFQATIAEANDQIFIRKGENFTLTLNNLKVWAWDITNLKQYWDTYDTGYFKILYTDGTYDQINSLDPGSMQSGFDYQYSSGTKAQYITLDFTARADVRKIIYYQSRILTYSLFAGSQIGIDKGFDVSLEIESEEVGLLSGILGKITDLWKTAEAGFANIVKGITELPQKLWEKIETGLKNLFVPSEESMTAYKDKWDELLESRLGAVYEVVNILSESWDDVMSADETNTITFPAATVNFSGVPFTFGGYEVKIVPDGFDFLANAVKLIIAIVCTIALVNGLRKRYDEVMGVEQ